MHFGTEIRNHLNRLLFLLLATAVISVSHGQAAVGQDDESKTPAVVTTPDDTEQAPVEAGASNSEQTRHRLVLVALVGATLLGWLAVLFAYLRLEHATRGFYSGKLQSVAVVCALAILGLCYFFYLSLFP